MNSTKPKQQRSQPERVLRELVIDWFAWQANCMVWVNASRGYYSLTLKKYLPLNAKGMRKGVSDLLGIWRGRPLAIELKPSKKEKPTTEQVEFLNDFNKNGGIGFVAYSLEDVQRELKARG